MVLLQFSVKKKWNFRFCRTFMESFNQGVSSILPVMGLFWKFVRQVKIDEELLKVVRAHGMIFVNLSYTAVLPFLRGWPECAPIVTALNGCQFWIMG